MRGVGVGPIIVAAVGTAIAGCAHGAGTITASSPKVWREDAIMRSTDRQLAALTKFAGTLNLEEVQGRRIRTMLGKTTFAAGELLPPRGQGSAASPQPEAPAGSAPAEAKQTDGASAPQDLPDEDDLPLAIEQPHVDALAVQYGEEPLDGLQRVEDFHAVLEGAKLAHQRDTASQRDGYALYLLGFDVSVNPGPATRTGYEGYLRFEVAPAPDSGLDARTIQVYSISPERYEERFSETFFAHRRRAARLQAVTHHIPWHVKSGSRLTDDLAAIERYPIMTGFVEGQHAFGWVFHPRPRVADSGKAVEYALEPGVWHCYALVSVMDGSLAAPNWLTSVDGPWLQWRMQHKDREAFARLRTEYGKLLATLRDGNANGQRDYLEAELTMLQPDQLDRAFAEYERLTKLGKTGSDDPAYDDAPEMKALLEPYLDLHKGMLPLIGAQGALRNQNADGPSLDVRVSGAWVRRERSVWSLLLPPRKRFEPLLSAPERASQSLRVVLPDKIDRTLEKVWAIWPEEVPGNQAGWASIKGQGFENKAEVYFDGQRATAVRAVSRGLILAHFPKYAPHDPNATKECGQVKVYVGGDVMVSGPHAFCRTRPFDSATQADAPRALSVAPPPGAADAGRPQPANPVPGAPPVR